MTSKFSIKSFFPILCIIPLIFGLTVYCIFAFDKNKIPPPLHGIPLILLLTFTLAWLFFGEFRTKMIKVKLEENYIIIKQFGGLGKGKEFLYSDLDGFKTSILRSAGANNEYLYFMRDNKKVGKISDFYHKNYKALKSNIETKLDNLGFENFSYTDEFKESFT
jgi:hypothetical protein